MKAVPVHARFFPRRRPRAHGGGRFTLSGVLYLAVLVVYGAAYVPVFLALVGPFLGPGWLLAGAAITSLLGRRPTRIAVAAVLAGFCGMCIALELWVRGLCSPPSCGTTPLLDDLIWFVVGLGEVLLGVLLWWWLSRPGKKDVERSGTVRRGWGWYVLALLPMGVVVLAGYAYYFGGQSGTSPTEQLPTVAVPLHHP